MAIEQNIPTPWIGAEELPVHFANAFSVAAAPNAMFMLFGSVMPPDGDAGPPPFVPVRPIVRLAIAPAAVPQLIKALTEAHKVHQQAKD
ncbi:MAG: hypothetical protein WBQ21_09620 [Solirubrobacteraceae bacterium]